MRNADTPAMPQDGGLFCERIGECPTVGTGFTKYEVVLLEFAKALTQHYSRSFELLSRHYDEIMDEAASMTDAYFDRLENRQ